MSLQLQQESGAEVRTAQLQWILVIALMLRQSEVLAENEAGMLYRNACATCHQPDGRGVKGAYPGLIGSAIVRGDAAVLGKLVLDGRGGMPSFSSELSDDELARVLTFIRNAWGNNAGAVSAEAIRTLRTEARSESAEDIPIH